MNADAIEEGVWSRRRWVAVVGLVVLAQVGFIFWLGETQSIKVRLPATGAAMYFPADQTAPIPGVSDPTLFVLPHRQGFSGSAWLNVHSVENHFTEWTEPEPSPAPMPELGGTLDQFVDNNLSRPFEAAAKPDPQLNTMEYPPPANALAAYSACAIEGALAGRRLLAPLKLNSPPAGQILTNSEVLVAVNPEGTVFSAVLLTRCGPRDDAGAAEADRAAVELARSARFEPLRWDRPMPPVSSPASFTWGKIIFRWHTSPQPVTNTAAKNP